MEKTMTGYESPSWWYDIRGFFILKLAYRGSVLKQLRFFSRNIGPKHLEVAIGSGTLFQMIVYWLRLQKKPICDVTGVDYAEQMLAGAHRRFGGNTKVKLSIGDVHRLQFDDQMFDTINVANAIHCFSKIDLALQEMYRVLKPGGTMATNVLVYPLGNGLQRAIANRINQWGKRKGILHTPYLAEEFRSLARHAGFEVDQESLQGNGLFLVLRKPR